MRDALAWDDGAHPDERLRCIASQISAMGAAGELDALPEYSRRLLAALPLVIMNISGDVRLLRDETGAPGPLGVALGDVMANFLSRRRIAR